MVQKWLTKSNESIHNHNKNFKQNRNLICLQIIIIIITNEKIKNYYIEREKKCSKTRRTTEKINKKIEKKIITIAINMDK